MSDDYITKDSGQREQHSTGAQRDSRKGKGRYDLLPSEPIRRVADVYERGEEKYGPNNWTLGMPLSRFLDSALRHTFQYLGGERDEDHLAQACFNLMAVMYGEKAIGLGQWPDEYDDLPVPHLRDVEDSEPPVQYYSPKVPRHHKHPAEGEGL